MTKTEEDFKALEFITQNSKEIIEKQVGSYRQQHTYAGTIIGFTTLFIPFFLSTLEGSNDAIQIITIIPIAIFISAILLLLSIFRGKPLDQALSVDKYAQLASKNYKEVLMYEVEANRRSYIQNLPVTKRANKVFVWGIGLTTVAIMIAIILLLINTFMVIDKAPAKFRIIQVPTVIT